MSGPLSGSGLQVVPGPAKPEWLADVAAAREHWDGALERANVARAVYVAAVETARDMGAPLGQIAAELGVTRQMVSKLLVEARRTRAETEAAAAALERDVNRTEREQLRGLTYSTRDRQCRNAACRRLKSRPSDVCDYCGDDPVGNIALGGSEWAPERAQYDAAHGGGIR